MVLWSQGLFNCCDDTGLCVVTFCCPCLTAGRNASGVGKPCLLYGCLSVLPIVGLYVRTKVRGEIRELQSIRGDIVSDVLSQFFCPFCSIIQEAAELENRGTRYEAGEQNIERY